MAYNQGMRGGYINTEFAKLQGIKDRSSSVQPAGIPTYTGIVLNPYHNQASMGRKAPLRERQLRNADLNNHRGLQDLRVRHHTMTPDRARKNKYVCH